MAKSNEDVHWDNVETFKYRWEFLRRNPEYKEDYKAWEKFKTLSWENPRSPYLEIMKKYLFPPLDYEKNYKELAEEVKQHFKRIDELSTEELEQYLKKGGKKLSCKEECQNRAYEWFRHGARSLIVEVYPDSASKEYRMLLKHGYDVRKNPLYKSQNIKLVVNLEYPKEITLHAVGEMVDFFKINLLELSEKTWKRQRRTSYRKYIKYLKIYDLKTKQGKKYKDIIDVVFKKDIDNGKGQDGLIVKAKRQFKEAERLVMGGYKEIK